MTLIAQVSKSEVVQIDGDLFDIKMKLILLEDAVEVFEKKYSIRYIRGDDINDKITQFITAMQFDIDKYEDELQIFNAAQFDTAVSSVQSGLVI